MTAPFDADDALAFVRRHGVVLASARGRAPNLVEAIAGRTIKGSWWGDPDGKRIFRILSQVTAAAEVLVCRLVDGRITLLHSARQRRWPSSASSCHDPGRPPRRLRRAAAPATHNDFAATRMSDRTMSDSQPQDSLDWHRKFAAAGNNRAWDLSVQARGDRGDREMLDAAHASAWHWSVVGSQLHHARATMLLAEVHALLGMAPSALRHAEEMREFFLMTGAPDWEIAFVHAIHAHAAAVAGEREAHAASYALAVAALAAIADEEERAIVAKTFEHVPQP